MSAGDQQRSHDKAHHGSGEAPRAGDPFSCRNSLKIFPPDAITLERWPGDQQHRVQENGPTRCGNIGVGLGSEVSLKDFPQGHYDRALQRGRSARPGPTRSTAAGSQEFQALPDLDANANAVTFEHIKLENEV